MKLKRFKNDEINESRSQMFWGDNRPQMSEENQRLEIIENLAQHWNEKLKNDYFVPRSLYKYSLAELKQIEITYIGESVIKESEEPKVDSKLTEALEELKAQHSSNEAVEEIRIEGDGIVFDVKCETDIQGTEEYNGIKLSFNKLCEIPQINESYEIDIMSSEEEQRIYEESQKQRIQLIREFFNISENVKETINMNKKMNYKDFDKLVKSVKNQFLIHTKDGNDYFIMLRNQIHYNMVGCVATNEKTFELSVLEYEDMIFVVVDGIKYEFEYKK